MIINSLSAIPRIGVISAFVAMMFIERSGAMDFSLQPQVRIGTRILDNVRWSTDDPQAAFGFDSGGGVNLKAESSTWKSTITPSFNIRRFIIGEDLDAEEYGVSSAHQWQATERISAEVKLDYARDSTLTTELTDVGRQNDVSNRDTITVNPTVNFQITDLTGVNSSFLYSTVSFESDSNGRLVDYSFKQITLGGTHSLSEILQISFTGFISEFEVPDQGGQTRTFGMQSGISYQYSEDLSLQASAGYVKSYIDFIDGRLVLIPGPPLRIARLLVPAEATTSGPIASASIRKNFEKIRAQFDYVRRVSPSIRGSQTLSDDIAINLERNVLENASLRVRAGYNLRSAESEDIGGNIGDLNRDLAIFAGIFTYRHNANTAVRYEYRFAHQVNATTDSTIDTNGVFVTLLYSGDPTFFLNR